MSEEAELFGQADEGGEGRRAMPPAYQVLARRSRPQSFAEVVGQEHVTQTLVNAVASGRVAHAFVFSGMRGVGKTTTARILARALNCEQGPTPDPCNRCRSCVEITEGRSLDVFEVDAASQTGIDATRELLETVKYQPAVGRFRVYIIDEAHGLSRQAVDAFLKTLEEPPPHAKFILATTAVHKLPPTILSRCQRYDFRALPAEIIVRSLAAMVEKEGRSADEDALLAIARESGGSLRDAVSLLDQVLAFADGAIDAATIRAALGLPDLAAVRALCAAMVARDPAAALECVAGVAAQGTDLARFAHALLTRIRNLAVLAVAGRAALPDLAGAELEELEGVVARTTPADLQRWFKILLDGQEEIAHAADPRLVFEMSVIRMATLEPVVPLVELVERLEALERGGERTAPARGPSSGSSRPEGGALREPARGEGRRSSAPSTGGSRTASSGAAPGLPAETSAEQAAAAGAETADPAQPRWKGLVDSLQRENLSRFFRLAYSKVIALGEDAIRIGVTGREAVNALLEPDTRRLIEQAIEREFGRALRFEPTALRENGGSASAPPDARTLDRRGREDPVVQLSVEVLQGQVEAVMPRARRES